MRLIFFGTGEFGVPALKALLGSDHEIVLVVTQPDREKGRGWKVQATPIKAFLTETASDVEIYQPEKASHEESIDFIKAKHADLFVVVDYGQLLKKNLLSVPSKYCINIHPSLLPKYRGASPLNYCMLNGDKETGVTIFKMDEAMDAGDIIVTEKVPVNDDDDVVSLAKRLSDIGADLVVKVVFQIVSGEENFLKQDDKQATYAPKIAKQQGEIDWKKPTSAISGMIKGLKPWPNAFTYLDGKRLKILDAINVDIKESGMNPGSVYDQEKFIIITGDGAIKINKLQLEGKKEMNVDEFLRGYNLNDGKLLGE